MNGLKEVNKGCPQICKHEKKASYLEKENFREQQFSFRHDIKHPSGNTES